MPRKYVFAVWVIGDSRKTLTKTNTDELVEIRNPGRDLSFPIFIRRKIEGRK